MTDDLLRAGNRARTGDLNLGKVALYQLSYARNDLPPSRADPLYPRLPGEFPTLPRGIEPRSPP
jgi:hypothetical protein